jgi:cardiolipin synthase
VGRKEGQEGLLIGRDAVKLMIQPEAGLVPVVQAIQRAKRTVDIAIFRLNRQELETALGAAVQRGVKVRALVAHTNRGGEERLRKLEQRLLAVGVTVSRSGDDLLKYHGKYLLVDDSLYLFAFNYTKADTTRSRSFGVQTRDRRAVKDASRLFECDLTRQPYQASPRSPLIVSPENARESLLKFIHGARRRLAIYDERLEDTAFVNLLRQRSAKGVQVQVIGRAPRLTAGSEVRPLRDLRLHMRAIIRDGTRAFVGSQSLRRLELDRRREVGLIVKNPAVTRRMLDVFEQDWEASAPSDGDKGSASKDKDDKDKKDVKKDGPPAEDKK